MTLTLGILLAVVGLGMLGFWTMHIVKGGLPQGIRTLENGGFICFHIFTELSTGVLCITGGLGLASGAGWGRVLSLFAAGMLAYASVNSLAWSEVRTKPAFAVMFVVPAMIAVTSGLYLIFS